MTVPRAVALASIAATFLVAFALTTAPEARAQVPATEEQALAIERQLNCPICVNERLDACGRAICQDMKRIIRERLEAGSSPDDIILFFETRYGPSVRAQLEPRGFNLWLYGWIIGSTAAVAVLGGWFLLGLRRNAQPVPVPPPAEAPDDSWLDAQIADDDDRLR